MWPLTRLPEPFSPPHFAGAETELATIRGSSWAQEDLSSPLTPTSDTLGGNRGDWLNDGDVEANVDENGQGQPKKTGRGKKKWSCAF